VVPQLVKENIGVLGMKSMANGIILKSGTVTARECLRYALNLPTSVVITGIDRMDILDQAFEVASSFSPLSSEERNGILQKTAAAASGGKFELFKTSSIFDGTAKNLDWMGEEPARLQQMMPA
jgi:BioD-like phosphotransacetylase family protein